MKLTTVEMRLCLDSTLTMLAEFRSEAATLDDITEAARIDAQWKEFDERRQRLIARATDRDLLNYEEQRSAGELLLSRQ